MDTYSLKELLKHRLAGLAMFFLAQTPMWCQFWVAGDSAGYSLLDVGQTFNPNVTVGLDIDCDGGVDFSIQSTDGNLPGNPWDRLTMILQPDVEVYNSGTGLVTAVEAGDTVYFRNADWTHALNFIYGTGVAGSYGQYSIDNKYIAFRKNQPDTTYFFIRFSNTGIVFTIHDIITLCPQNPLFIVGTDDEDSNVERLPVAQPNPFNDRILLSGKKAGRAQLINASGNVVYFSCEIEERTIQLPDLPPGIYFIMVTYGDGSTRVEKMVRE